MVFHSKQADGRHWLTTMTDWKDKNKVECVLESQPYDCKGYKRGQTLKLPVEELLDYVIGSESTGVVEAGLTQRIAEDYGMVIP